MKCLATFRFKTLTVKSRIIYNSLHHSYTIKVSISKPLCAYYESFLFAKMQNAQHFLCSFEMLYREDSVKCQQLQHAMLYSTFRDIQGKIASQLERLT